MAIQDAIEVIQDKARATAGILQAPYYLDERAANSPVACIAYLASGTFGTEAYGQGHDLHNIQVDIAFSGAIAEAIERKAEGILEDFVDNLRGDPTLSATVQTIVGDIAYTVTRQMTNNVYTLVFSVTVPVKMRPTFTIS